MVLSTFAKDDPKWSELNELFGQKITSPKAVSFVTSHELSKAVKGGSGSFHPKNYSYSVMFRRDIVSTVILQVSPPNGYGEKHWTQFKGELPAKIKRSHLRKDIIKMFGKSHTPKGDTWISGDLEIWIFFNDKTGIIDELYISKAETKTKQMQNKRK